MKERPILFSAPMVRAILEGRKTQTRRVVKGGEMAPVPFDRIPSEEIESLEIHGWREFVKGHLLPPCPYGQPGDRLWVRESCHADDETNDTVTLAKYSADGSHVLYSGKETNGAGESDYGGSCAHWWYSRNSCPSIHMPREFSRITLEITEVRVERLQDITPTAAEAEGVGPWQLEGVQDDYYRQGFRVLWDGLNADRGAGWDANPWVWAVEFKRVTP